MSTVLDGVVGPDRAGALGPQSEARAVREPEPAAPGLRRRDLPSVSPPEALHPLVVNHPARLGPQQLGNLALALAAVTAGELDDVGGEPFFVVPAPRDLALRRAVLTEHPADPALGEPELPADVPDASAPPRGA
jgi:hypothetical protein